MNEELAIQIKGLKKQYRLGQIGGGTLKADLQSWWARVRHQEDPNSKIGADQRVNGQTFMALNGIDLTVKKGEALGIIGGNGAGKSTMLKILSRITAPTEGCIDINGRITSMLEVGTGFNAEMTGRENIYMNGAILGMTRAEIDAKMEDIIEFSEVREFIDTPVKRYSSGMYVKLAFSVAAHLDSEIMIMDEVLAVGDMAFQQKCLDKMRDAAKVQGRTVLYVSHNMNTIRRLCDRCIVLDQGRIIFDGDVEEAISAYLATSNLDRRPSISLCQQKRPRYIAATAKLKKIVFEDTTDCSYPPNNRIPATLYWQGCKQLKDVRVRLMVATNDGSPVGLAASEVLSDVQPNENVESKLYLDFSGLVEGDYRLTISLYQMDDMGNSVMLDTVERACVFAIRSNSGLLRWHSKNWGCIRFPEIKKR